MKKKKGQAILETVLVLPILLFVFCAIIDFGRILHAGASLNMVAQESVRLAGLGSSDSEVAQFAYDKVHLTDKDTINVNIIPTELERKSGDYVAVEVNYEVKYITPLMKFILPSPFVVHSKSTIRVE